MVFSISNFGNYETVRIVEILFRNYLVFDERRKIEIFTLNGPKDLGNCFITENFKQNNSIESNNQQIFFLSFIMRQFLFEIILN